MRVTLSPGTFRNVTVLHGHAFSKYRFTSSISSMAAGNQRFFLPALLCPNPVCNTVVEMEALDPVSILSLVNIRKYYPLTAAPSKSGPWMFMDTALMNYNSAIQSRNLGLTAYTIANACRDIHRINYQVCRHGLYRIPGSSSKRTTTIVWQLVPCQSCCASGCGACLYACVFANHNHSCFALCCAGVGEGEVYL
jgi:hypothetical protein